MFWPHPLFWAVGILLLRVVVVRAVATATAVTTPTALRRVLSSQQQDPNNNNNNQMVDSSYDTAYDGYQQAWRYLGFYVECNNNNNLQKEQENENQSACQRYLLWAAYIDLNYTGGGTGEYQYYDVTTNTWDTTACNLTQNARCAKMDCHLDDEETTTTTNWQLLGMFRQADYMDWFEQLFKHQGYCLWNQENTYEFMYGNYKAWPETCTATETINEDGDLLYYDIHAMADGNMTIGLYIDAACSMDYTGDIYTTESFLAADQDGDDALDLLVGTYADQWNEAMSVYKICQPCRASNLRMTEQNNARKLEDNNDSPNHGYFQCNDMAGYTDVNQCMKFRTQTDLEYATAENVITASRQGSLLATNIHGITYGAPLSSIAAIENTDQVFSVTAGEHVYVVDDNAFLWLSASVLLFAIITWLCCSSMGSRCWTPSSPSASLMEQSLIEASEKQ